MPFAATWMNLELIILGEVSQRKRQMPYDFAYMWNPKKIIQMIFTKQKQT